MLEKNFHFNFGILIYFVARIYFHLIPRFTNAIWMYKGKLDISIQFVTGHLLAFH